MKGKNKRVVQTRPVGEVPESDVVSTVSISMNRDEWRRGLVEASTRYRAVTERGRERGGRSVSV